MMTMTTTTVTAMRAATATGITTEMTGAGAMIMAVTKAGGVAMATATETTASGGTANGGAVAMATKTGTMATTIAVVTSTVRRDMAAARYTTEVTRTVWARRGETCLSANPSTPILAAARIAATTTTTGIRLATSPFSGETGDTGGTRSSHCASVGQPALVSCPASSLHKLTLSS